MTASLLIWKFYFFLDQFFWEGCGMVNEPICKIGGGTFFLDWLTWAFGSKSSQSDLLQIHLEFDPILFMAASVTPAQGKCSQRLHLASHLHWLFTFVDYFYLKFMSPLLIELWISFVSSVRSSNSHPDLLVITSTTTTTPLFQIHTGPQHWTFTFWATTAI